MRRYYEEEKTCPELAEQPDQKTWFRQIEWVLPYCRGFGLDVGSGGRTLHKRIVCLDANPAVRPHVVADGCYLPFRDRTFDFVLSNQSIEHMSDTRAALLEWLRVSRQNVCVVGPDVRIHGKPGSLHSDPGHLYMYTGDEFFALVQSLPGKVQILDMFSDVTACPDFFCVFSRGV